MAPLPEKTDIDNLLHGLKDFGKFQLLQCTVLNMMLIPCAHILLEVVFIAYRPNYQCRNLTSSQMWTYNASNIVYQKCSIELQMNPNESSVQSKTIPCVNGLDFSGPIDESIVSEWNLVCNNDGLSELTQTLLTVGQSAGALIFPSLADRIGRKPIHVGCGVALFLTATGCSLASNYWLFAILRGLCGVFQQGMLIPGFTMSLELFPANRRTLMVSLVNIWWAVSVTLLAPLAYAVRFYSWRVLTAVVGCTAVFSVFEFWYIHESVRWLFANNQIDKGKKILQTAANVNGVDFDALWTKSMELLEKTSSEEKSKDRTNLTEDVTTNMVKNSRHNSVQIEADMIEAVRSDKGESTIAMIGLMKNPHTRYISFVIQYAWLIISLTYFGLYLTSSSLSGDRYTNYFLTALMEIPSTIILMKMFMAYGRKKTIVSMMLVAAGGLVAVSILKSFEKSYALDIVSTVFFLIGMAGISGACSGMWLYTPEIFPTNLRTAAMGLASATARLGSMVSSYTRILAMYAPWAPGLIFGGGCLLACSLFFLLPETHNRQLPQTVEQMEEWMQQQKEKRIGKKKQRAETKKNIIFKKNPLIESKLENKSENKTLPADI